MSNTLLQQDVLRKEGLAGPFELENKLAVHELADFVLSNPGSPVDRHCDLDIVRNVFLDKNLQSAVLEHFGAELLLWRTNFFVKKDGSGEVGWHHDRHFEDGDEAIDLTNLSNHFSILIAVTDIEQQSGVIEYVEGSHLPMPGVSRDLRPYHKKQIKEHFCELPADYQERVKSIPLKQGQFALFHSALLHHSQPFVSGAPRISMIGRLARKGLVIPTELAPPESVMSFTELD